MLLCGPSKRLTSNACALNRALERNIPTNRCSNPWMLEKVELTPRCVLFIRIIRHRSERELWLAPCIRRVCCLFRVWLMGGTGPLFCSWRAMPIGLCFHLSWVFTPAPIMVDDVLLSSVFFISVFAAVAWNTIECPAMLFFRMARIVPRRVHGWMAHWTHNHDANINDSKKIFVLHLQHTHFGGHTRSSICLMQTSRGRWIHVLFFVWTRNITIAILRCGRKQKMWSDDGRLPLSICMVRLCQSLPPSESDRNDASGVSVPDDCRCRFDG